MAQTEANISDIYTFLVFAVIDKRNGKLQGHEVLLTANQQEAIEAIIKQSKVRVLETKEFDLIQK